MTTFDGRKYLELSEKEFWELNETTRRKMILKLMFIKTPKYLYCVGALGEWWTMARYERIDSEHISDDCEIVDKWL